MNWSAAMLVRRSGDRNACMTNGLSNVCLLLVTHRPTDSPWLGPYLVVSLAGWVVGVQLHPDSPVLLIHFQDLKIIPWCPGFNRTNRILQHIIRLSALVWCVTPSQFPLLPRYPVSSLSSLYLGPRSPSLVIRSFYFEAWRLACQSFIHRILSA